MDFIEWSWLQGIGRQAVCRWFGDGGLAVLAVRVNARTVPIAPAAVAASAVPGGPAGRRECHRRTERLTRADRSKTRLHPAPAPITVVAEHRDQPCRVNTGLAAPGRRPARNRAQSALRCAAPDVAPSRPGAA